MTSSELISRYYTAFNAKDWQTMLDCVSDTVRHHVNEGGERFGKEKFRAFLAHMDECYDEKLRDIVVMETPDGARAAAEFKVHGIYKKTDSGLPPANGQPYVLPAGAFFEIRNGLIERVTTYYNLQEWISQVSRRAEITLRAVSGEALEPLIPALAEMRIKVFAAYPYLYAGTAAYEQEYLRGFASAPDAVVVVATDPTGRVVGCATGSSLTGRHAEFSAPFAAAGYDLSSTFYFGESVLDPAWRSRGIGHVFFDMRERHALDRGYSRACFCAVIRAENDPRKPAGYSPLDAFWRKRGYQRLPGVETVYHWPEVEGGPSVAHSMAYWIKEF